MWARKASKYVVVPLCVPTANAASVCGCVKDMTTEATVPSLGIKLVTTAPTKTGGVGGTIEPPLLEKYSNSHSCEVQSLRF